VRTPCSRHEIVPPSPHTAMMRSLTILCPAKINFFLDVKGKRPDGFHELYTVMQTIDLGDELLLEEHDMSLSLTCDKPGLPVDSRNLCVRAAEAMRRAAGALAGVRIRLIKKIPVAAGLGGGSSDAAGMLRGLNRLWRLGMTEEMLRSVAGGLGSDVPFFISGGTALCTGRGERIATLPDMPSYPYVLVTPPIAVSTADVYRSLSAGASPAPVTAEECVRALSSEDPARLARALYNRLEIISGAHMRDVAKIKSILLAHGSLGAQMSGSGPSVYGIARDPAEARRIAGEIKDEIPAGSFLHWGLTNVPCS